MSSTSPIADPDGRRLANLLGAWTLALGDRITAAAAAAAGRGGQAPSILVALREFANGQNIEELRTVLGLTHSATVRLVDSLEADGLVARRPERGDRRSVAIILTTKGHRRASQVLAARQAAIEATLANLTDSDTNLLTPVVERLVHRLVDIRLEERRAGARPAGGWLCRMCNFDACGRSQGRCPAAAQAGGR